MSNQPTHREPDSESLPPEAEPQGEELVHVPKGKNRLQFLFLVFLLIFMLVVFVVGDAMQGACAGGGERTAMRWKHPSAGEISVSLADFYAEKERLQDLNGRNTIEDSMVATFLIQDRLAADAGVVVSDSELADQLRQFSEMLGGAANYKQRVAGFRGGVRAFEDTLRRTMRVQRYSELLVTFASQPRVEEIESLWNQDHVELAFQYVELEVASLHADARAELPDSATLEAWFAARPERERASYALPERLRAETLGWIDGQALDATKLLAKYPPAEGADAEAAARAYYDQVFYLRFRRPEPLPAGEGSDPVEDAQRRFYYSFDEVAERARQEAPVQAALQALLADLSARLAAGTAVDLAAEAAALGLAHLPADAARSQAEWSALVPEGGSALASRLAALPVGEFGAQLIIDEDALLLARLAEKLPASQPPFAEIAERVGEDWVKERAGEMAVKRLEDLRQSLRPAPAEGELPADPASAVVTDTLFFTDVVQKAGLQVEFRDWLDHGGPLSDDRQSGLPAHQFLRERREYTALQVGDVPPPALDRNKDRAYLVRLDGSRPVAFERMTPMQLASYQSRAATSAGRSFAQGNFGELETLKAVWGLWLFSDPALFEGESGS